MGGSRSPQEISALVKATLTDDLKTELPLQFIPLHLGRWAQSQISQGVKS